MGSTIEIIKMNDIMRNLILNGFAIYSVDEKFAVKKQAVSSNNLVLEESTYPDYDSALNAALEFLEKSPMEEWIGIVRYNRGLGIEYKNLNVILASTQEKALQIAKNLAYELFDDPKFEIIEVKVKPKNRL
jgi:hypothetical protein